MLHWEIVQLIDNKLCIAFDMFFGPTCKHIVSMN